MKILATALLALPAAAQSFDPGDIYLYSPAFQGSSSASGAIARVDPAGGGAMSLFLDLASSSHKRDQIAYDPFRDRLIFYGGFQPNTVALYLADASGAVTKIGFDGVGGNTAGGFAPRGDGNIYFTSPVDTQRISRLDPTNQTHLLLDATGSGPYVPNGWFVSLIQAMEYHAPTNSLVIAFGSNQGTCAGGSNQDMNIRRLDLSADGTRVIGESCWQYDLQPGAFDGAVAGLTPLNGGDLLMAIDNNNTLALPRMARIDPVAKTAVPYATNDHPFSAAVSAGMYSSARNQAVLVDSGEDVLRAFSEGTNGPGVIIATNTSASGGTSEVASLIEIGAGGGAGYVMTATPTTLSATAGGTQNWSIDFGAALAGNFYLVAGSTTGWMPATNYGGVAVPIVSDGYTLFTINNAGGAFLPGSVGVLDALGQASASLVLPPAVAPSFVGVTGYHATLAFSPALVPLGATNAVSVKVQ